jgi:PKD repeat protein
MFSGSTFSGAPFSAVAGVFSFVAPVADFSATPLAGVTPLSVTFTDLSTNTPTAWDWKRDSGSGFSTFSTDQNPVETFTAATWSIRLTASNAFGSDTETKTAYIVVSPVPLLGRVRNIDAGQPSRSATAAVPTRGIIAGVPSRSAEASA